MSAVTFDTLRMVKRLREAGFSDVQAEAVTDMMRETREMDLSNLATKHDVASVKQDLAAVKQELKQDIDAVKQEIAAVRQDLKQEIAGVRQELKQDIAAAELRFKAYAESIKSELLKWLFPLMFGQVAATVALIKLL